MGLIAECRGKKRLSWTQRTGSTYTRFPFAGAPIFIYLISENIRALCPSYTRSWDRTEESFPPCLFFPSNTPSGFSVPWAKSNIPEVFAQIPGLYTAHKCQLQAINAAWGAFSRGSRLTGSRDRRDWHVECWQLIFWKVHQHPRLRSCTTCTIW